MYSLKTTQSLLVQAGFGIALLPVSMVKASCLHAIDIIDEGCESGVVLAYHERDSTLVTAFVEHFRNAFSELPLVS